MKRLVEVVVTTVYNIPVQVNSLDPDTIRSETRDKWTTMDDTERLRAVVDAKPLGITDLGEVAPPWSALDSSRASGQGWYMRDSSQGLPYIAAHTGPRPAFKSDTAANHWVRYQAAQGDELAQRALVYLETYKNR